MFSTPEHFPEGFMELWTGMNNKMIKCLLIIFMAFVVYCTVAKETVSWCSFTVLLIKRTKQIDITVIFTPVSTK